MFIVTDFSVFRCQVIISVSCFRERGGRSTISRYRELILNWSPAHKALREAIENKVTNPMEVGETGKGWTYITFCRPGLNPKQLLFDVDRLEALARENHFYLPGDVVRQHNKVVVSAMAPGAGPSVQLFGLYRLLDAFAGRYADYRVYPNYDFYGKLGGLWERTEKGRVLVMYGRGDDELLEICETMEHLVRDIEVHGVLFGVRLSNGLSAIPRILDGFHDPEYVKSGVDYFRVTDPAIFDEVLNEARKDYPNYLFSQPKE